MLVRYSLAAHRLHQVHRRTRGSDLRRLFLVATVIVFLLSSLSLPPVAAVAIGSLPAVSGLSPAELPQDMLIFDRNGALLADIGDQGDHRIVVTLAQVSPAMVDATLAIEDRSFYRNVGIDFQGILRAALANLTHHRILEGASTITQQLARQVFIGPNPPPTLQRKLREAMIAIALTRHYTKAQILELYLNTTYYGNQAYGVEAAARTYFHTTAHDLTLAQAALLAGIPSAPSAYNPVLHPQSAKERQEEVLGAMARLGFVTAQQAVRGAAEHVAVFPPENSIVAPHFVDYVLETLRRDLRIQPGDRRGYRVITSLDLGLQRRAEEVVRDQVGQMGDYYNFHDAALVSLNPKSGEVLAMVGGVDSSGSGGQINMATSATRQTGSAFKIFTYTAALETRQISMASPILDEPLVFPIGGGVDGYAPYAPRNYDLRFHGLLPAKMALGNSLNLPALKVELRTGIPAILSAARRMGATTLTRDDSTYWWSLTLGAYPVPVIDMAAGAATLAAMGTYHRPTAVLAVTDATGDQLFADDPAARTWQAVSPQVSFIMAAILSDDRNRCMEFGCHGDLTLPGRHVAAKTGTSEEFRDNWTLGFTPSLVTVVWVGNPDYSRLSHNSTGIVGAAPIWHRFMTRALAGTPDEWYPAPPGLLQVGDDYFLPGTEHLPPMLSGPWPRCPFSSYDPYRLTYAQMLVAGVPCTLGKPS